MDEKTLKQFKKIIEGALVEQETRLEARFEKKFVTKDDLVTFEKRLGSKFVTKEEFKKGWRKYLQT